MRKIILILIISCCWSASSAQITLEQSYASAPYIVFTNLQTAGWKYWNYDRWTQELRIYNMNHSIFKSIATPLAPTDTNSSVNYVSEGLFDLTTNVAYSVNLWDGGISRLRVYDEFGNLLFSRDSFRVQVILNTSSGTKMHLLNASFSNPYPQEIYSLPGTVTYFKKPVSVPSAVYPNPFSSYLKVGYSLPDGVDRGEVVLYSIKGESLKSYTVDRTFDHLLISTSDLPKGAYIYKLHTSKGVSDGKKLIKVSAGTAH